MFSCCCSCATTVDPEVVVCPSSFVSNSTAGETHYLGNTSPDKMYQFSAPWPTFVQISFASDFYFSARLYDSELDVLAVESTQAHSGELRAMVPPGRYFLLVEGRANADAGGFSFDVTCSGNCLHGHSNTFSVWVPGVALCVCVCVPARACACSCVCLRMLVCV